MVGAVIIKPRGRVQMTVEHFDTKTAVDVEFDRSAIAYAVCDAAIGAVIIVAVCKGIPDRRDQLDGSLREGTRRQEEDRGEDQGDFSHIGRFILFIDAKFCSRFKRMGVLTNVKQMQKEGGGGTGLEEVRRRRGRGARIRGSDGEGEGARR